MQKLYKIIENCKHNSRKWLLCSIVLDNFATATATATTLSVTTSY